MEEQGNSVPTRAETLQNMEDNSRSVKEYFALYLQAKGIKNSIFIYGIPVLAETDHKSVTAIAKWGLANTALKIIIFLQLQNCDSQVEYNLRTDLIVSQTSSKAFDKSAAQQSPELDYVHVSLMIWCQINVQK